MATLHFHLVQRTSNIGKNAGKKVFTAQPIIHRKLSFTDLCKQLADGSTVDEADIKAVLSRLSKVIVRNLELGMSVDCGDLGTFRAAFGSKGVLQEKDFNTSLISKPRVVFTPRVAFKNALHGVGFERTSSPAKAKAPQAGEPKPKPQEGGGSASQDDDEAGI